MMEHKKGLGITEVIGDKREAVLELARQYGVTNVRVFGSVARGEADDKSDVDFLVEYSANQSLLKRIGLAVALEDLLERKVDVLTDRTIKDFAKVSAIRDMQTL